MAPSCSATPRTQTGPVLRFTPAEWDAFLGGAKLGEFDRFARQAMA